MDLLWQKPLQGQKDTCLKREQIFWGPTETDRMENRSVALHTTQFDKWQLNRIQNCKRKRFYMNFHNYNLVHIQFLGFFSPHHWVLIPWRPHVVSLLCWKCVARSFLACCRCIACPECLSLLVTWARFWYPDSVWCFWVCLMLWDLNDKQCLNELT